MTLYIREQLMVLCVLLVLLFGWTVWQNRPPGQLSAVAVPRLQYVYEIAGQACSAGIYCYKTRQKLSQLFDAAGCRTALSDTAQHNPNMASGSRIVVAGQLTTESMSPQARINFFLPVFVNAATVDELALIPGIGVKTAHTIVDYRERNGGISDIGELRGIGGIGTKKFEHVAPYLNAEN